nr:RRP12-like protein isoform X1 [Ziziphus jujuba var. spinosa]
MEVEKAEHEKETETEHANSFSGGCDICQQLIDRYTKSTAPQHRHLIATAMAMRSILTTESLPLTPAAYFAATITAVENASSASQTLDSTAVAALLSFLAIVLPLVPPQGIAATKAIEAMQVLVSLQAREKEGLAMFTVRAAVKCLGTLVGFCDLEDWGSVKFGFETLLKFSVDRRPKVRRSSHDCLEKVFKTIQCSTVIKEASKVVLSMLKNYMPLAIGLSSSTVGTNDDILSKPQNLEVLHMLNVLKLTVPFLSVKVKAKVLSQVHKLFSSQFSALTRHILKIIEACFETSRVHVIAPETEKILVSLSSYVSLGDKIPLDTVMAAANLLKRSLNILRDGESSSYVKNLPLVCNSLAGLLTSEASTAAHASVILKQLINDHVDQASLVIDDGGQEKVEASEVKSICSIFENCLSTCDGNPNEHILAVISALFLKLGGISYYYMKSILAKLADLMTLASGSKSITHHLRNCIGSAVIAMGPERILTLVPISINAHDFSCVNIWLVPILRSYVVGASLKYYLEHIVPLAKSFQHASCKVESSTIGQDLQSHAHALWGLLPAFCRHPTDMYRNFKPLAEVFIKFLKEDSFMHDNVALALQVLVNQNKSALNPKIDADESYAVRDSPIEFGSIPTYSKKTATKNIKALVSYSTELLQTLTDLFIDSSPKRRSYLKDAIGCLASISDSSITKKIFISLLERFQFIDGRGEFGKVESQNELVDTEQRMEKDAQRYMIMELASSLVEGAKEDLIDLIYRFVKHSFQATDGIESHEACYTLSKMIKEHDWFCSSRFVDVIDLLFGLKSPVDIATLRSRFDCYHLLMVHALKINSEEENTKAFLILNEIILTLKDAKDEETRKAAYDILLKISSSLRDTPCISSDSPYQKLLSMIMGYLSGASPHIKSGAVSVLSVLIYKDTDICLSMPDLVPSLLSLLQGKSVEVIKAVLGFVKVLVSCLQAKDLQSLLSDVVNGVLPWSSVSRNHFRSKVTIIMEIILRKCGFPSVELVTPEKYRKFIKSVAENRHNKTGSENAAVTETERRQQKRKSKESGTTTEKIRFMKHTKRKEKKLKTNNLPSTNEPGMSIRGGDGRRQDFRSKHASRKISVNGQTERYRNANRRNFKEGPTFGGKKKMRTDKKHEASVHRPALASKLHKHKKIGKS